MDFLTQALALPTKGLLARLRPLPEMPALFGPLLIGQEGEGWLIGFKQGSGCMLRSPYERRTGTDPRSGERGANRARFPRRGNRSV